MTKLTPAQLKVINSPKVIFADAQEFEQMIHAIRNEAMDDAAKPDNPHLEQAFKNGKIAGMTRAMEICSSNHRFTCVSCNSDEQIKRAIEKERDAIK